MKLQNKVNDKKTKLDSFDAWQNLTVLMLQAQIQ